MSKIRKRSVVIGGHRTSVSLEDEFWREAILIAGESGVTLTGLISMIVADHHKSRAGGGRSGAVRLFVLSWYKALADSKRRAA